MKFIDDNIINEWVSQHYATINLSPSMALFDKLSALPWIAGHLDFSKLNHRLINVQEMLDNDDENQCVRINEWLKAVHLKSVHTYCFGMERLTLV
ncbi:hypothetical protein [Serratia marcescens]|uniref:hypothetical protein n=1 Tax=Serratia marcescens TaxID=615 RepID=UPI003FA758DD|nr:hypothetical protein [Serratia marcescens]